MNNTKPNQRRRRVILICSAIAIVILAAAVSIYAFVGRQSTDTVNNQTAATGTTDTVSSSTTKQTISSTATAARAFLATLSEEQKTAVLYDYDDETKSTSWSNFPVSFVERAGLNISQLTADQKKAALAVLESLLNEEAYATVSGIMGGDEFLHENSAGAEETLGQYYIAFFGTPSDSNAFTLQFGGHHLGINATLDGASDAITFAPTHLGLQPAVYTDSRGNEVQPFDGIYTDAFAFYNSLTDEQKAILTSGDVTMCAPGSTCDFQTGDGLKGADLTDEQKQLLLNLIANWAGMADEQSTEATLAKIKATLDSTVIAWSGETTYDMNKGNGISFSISGPNVYVGFQAQPSSTGADVDGVNTAGWGHVHTIYRDPSNDYAGSVTQAASSGPGAGTAVGGPRNR